MLHLVRSCFSLTPPSALGHASASSVIAHAKAARPMRLTPSPNACASAGHAQPLGAGGRCQRHRRGTVCGIFHCGVGRPGVPAIRRRPQGGGEDGAGQARVPRRGCRVREGRPCVQEGAPGAAEGASGSSAVHRPRHSHVDETAPPSTREHTAESKPTCAVVEQELLEKEVARQVALLSIKLQLIGGARPEDLSL